MKSFFIRLKLAWTLFRLGLSKKTADRASRIYACTLHGHSRVVYQKKGFVYCARCDQIIGCSHCHKEKMTEEAAPKVILGRDNKTQQRNKQMITAEDRLFLPAEVKKWLSI